VVAALHEPSQIEGVPVHEVVDEYPLHGGAPQLEGPPGREGGGGEFPKKVTSGVKK
jgi:hypothetical protein